MISQKDSAIAKEVLRIRLSQMIINEKYKNKEFKVPIHLALGHEAIAVAVNEAVDDNDLLALTHRNIHYNLARTQQLKPEIDEYMLKEEGLCGGSLGSMNLANEERGVIYTSNILANNQAVACGLAMAKKVKNEKGIVVMVIGDGAIEEGCFYESLLFAKSNDLPMINIIENNEWSLATRIEERRCDIDIDQLTSSLGISYVKLDSNDVYEYAEKLKEIKAKALSERAPVCVEVHLESLGSWIMEAEGYPDGKFINYHAGPAPEVNLAGSTLIKSDANDPVYVLRKYFDDETIKNMEQDISEQLEQELMV